MTIHLRTAKKSDCLRLWQWRNEPSVRKISFESKPIPFARHKAWFAKKIKDTNSKILIGEKRPKKPFGYARIDKTTKTMGEIHIAVQKTDRGKGLGDQLLRKACLYGFRRMRLKSIIAHIKADNPRSARLFASAGFKPVKKTSLPREKAHGKK